MRVWDDRQSENLVDVNIFANCLKDVKSKIRSEVSKKVQENNNPLSIAEYIAELSGAGERTFAGENGTFWISHGSGAITRIPLFYLASPDYREIRRLFWRGPVLIIDFIQEPDEHNPSTAWLYICSDPSYSVDTLVPSVRRNVHRGLRELRIVQISPDEVLSNGFQAFHDTRVRNGLSDGTPQEFKRRFVLRADNKGHVFYGAWKDCRLAAFLSVTEVDDWVEIEGCFSMNEFLSSRPNDTLICSIIKKYLADENRRVVTYGVSSIQGESNVAGLHAFKTKVGFEAKPVHRAFILHPLLRPFANRVTVFALNQALRLKPRNRTLKKARGMLSLICKSHGLAVHSASPRS